MDQLFSVMGVYAVTVAVMGAFIKYLIGKLDQKDDVILQMLPVLTDVQSTMKDMLTASTELVRTAAVIQDRRQVT